VYLVLVLGLAALGGVVVGITAGLAAFVLENYYFVQPLHSLNVARPDDLVSLLAFLLFATGASVLVSRFALRSYEADRARAEAQILASAVATTGTSHEDLLPLLDSLRAVFDAASVAIIIESDGQWRSDVVSGDPLLDIASATQFPIEDHYALALEGVALDGDDRQLVSAFAGRVAHGLRMMRSVKDAAQLRVLGEAEATRSGLMRAVSTDLSGSLEAIQFKVTSLLDGDVTAPIRVQRERLLAIETEVQRLSRVVNNIVDLGRLESQSVAVRPASMTMGSIVTHALASVDTSGHPLDIDVASDLPRLDIDPALAQRTLAIFIANACRFSPSGSPVRVSAGVAGDDMEVLVIDRGSGVSSALRRALFEPRQRLNAESGASLGLWVAAGYVTLLKGQIRLEDTPGGGLTVVLRFPRGSDPEAL
jgi:two-component system sensor histidine kinase KdpD